MKIAYGSDIHLEFGGVNLEVPEPPDLLVLAGDIFCVEPLRKMLKNESNERSNICSLCLEFFKTISKDFPETILIMGNHEHYNGYWNKTLNVLREVTKDFSNIHVLEKEYWEFRDKVFFGGTMWTDFDNNNPLSLYYAPKAMNDYRVITEEVYGLYRKLQPETCLQDHREFLKKLTEVYSNTDKDIIVVSHHAPHELSISEYYKGDSKNSYYYSNLQNFIESRPRIPLWLHGHIHSPSDYIVPGTNTRVLSNPRGYYKLEHNDVKFSLDIVEV